MDEQKLNEMYEMTRENNAMLKAMRRRAMIAGVVKFVFWVIVLVVIPYYLWLYIQPYLAQIQSTYQSVQDGQQSFANFDFGKFLEQFGGGSGK